MSRKDSVGISKHSVGVSFAELNEYSNSAYVDQNIIAHEFHT